LGQGIATWSQQSSSAGHQWTGTGVALDRPVSHRHPRLSPAPAFAATSRFQNSLMRQGTSGPQPAVAPSPDPKDGDAANDGPDHAPCPRHLIETTVRPSLRIRGTAAAL
jgi:hypothetical protein